MSQRGFATIFFILLLLLGIGIGLYLVSHPAIFKPKASESGQPAVGSLDLVDGHTVGGWAKDPDTDNPITVHIYIDGNVAGYTEANVDRPDVGRHGFTWTIPTLGKGSHSVTVYAIGVNPDGTLSGVNPPLNNSPTTYIEGAINFPFNFSGVSDKGANRWTSYLTKALSPGSAYNAVGLSGNVSISSQTDHTVIVLYSLINRPNGDCFPEGKFIPPQETPNAAFPPGFETSVTIASFILKLNNPGTSQIPTEIMFPVKVPLTGCTQLFISGGDPDFGEEVTMNSNMTFLYDTELALSPAPYFINLGDEFCIGRPPGTGCYSDSLKVTPEEAFLLIKPMKENVRLWSLTGNMATAGSVYPPSGIGFPSGAWSAPSDYFIYPKCTNPTSVTVGVTGESFGPAVSLSQVPAGATNLFSTVLNGNGRIGEQKTVTKYFSDPPVLLNQGDCLVHMQKFNTDGGLSAESQIVAVVQPIVKDKPAVGSLDLVDGHTVGGWAKDPDTDNPIMVHIYIDGKLAGDTEAKNDRSDVGKHGFAWTIPPLGKGTHTVNVYAIGVNPDGSLTGDNPPISGSPKTYTEGYKELPFKYSGVSRQGVIGAWTTFVVPQSAPASNYNFVGLSGNISISGQSNNDAIVLFSLLNFPDGNCPQPGQNDNLALGIDNYLTSFILKLNKPGTAQTPTEFMLPVKVPLKGCMAFAMSGGEAGFGDPIIMNMDVKFLYDTEAAPSPAPYFINLGDEFCTGREPNTGCFVGAPAVAPQDAFALIKKIKEPVRLWSLTGNMATAGLLYSPDYSKPPTRPYPSGSWSAPSDHYVYPQCQDPASSIGRGVPYSDSFGPSSLLSQIPSNAKLLFSTTLNGSGSVGDQKTVTKYFSDTPFILQKGDCLVHLQKFSADGALSAESQVYALVQPIASPTAKVGDIQPDAGDNDVDLDDFLVFVSDYRNHNLRSDFNHNGGVDLGDFTMLAENYGKLVQPSFVYHPQEGDID